MAEFKRNDEHEIRTRVRDHYGKFAEQAAEAEGGCCSGSAESSRTKATDVIYGTPEVSALPDSVKALSAGCGDPVTLAELEPGQNVLDLGSGGGIDCFYAAQKVGPEGRVIGVDMTPAMLEKARQNGVRLGLENVEFRLGEIEHLPVPDGVIDVVISNCVINLSPNKDQVFKEAFRVLKPGGRIAVSDIVRTGPLPAALQANPQGWCECVSGALEADEFISGLENAGFTNVKLEEIDFGLEEGQALLISDGLPATGNSEPFSARITARKPGV